MWALLITAPAANDSYGQQDEGFSETFNDTFSDTFSNTFIAAELQRARTDPDRRVRFTAAAPVEYVFNFLLTRVPDYSENAVALRFANGESGRENGDAARITVGSERLTTMDDGGELSQRILLYRPYEQYAYFTDLGRSSVDLPLDYSIGYYSFREIDDQNTEVSVSVVYQPSSRLFGFLVSAAFDRALGRDFKRAAQIIESLYQREVQAE